MAEPNPARPPPCRFYAQGHCRAGAECRFSHEAPPPLGGAADGPDGAHAAPARKAPPCRFFAQGKCRNPECRFSHELPPGGAEAGGERGGVAPDPRPPVLPEITGPLFSVDVECVATGVQHHDRAIAHIGIVDALGSPVLNVYVKPDKPVASYLGPLTGLSAELIEQHGVPLELALERVRACLPPSAQLVGQDVLKDIHWLGLAEGKDFGGSIDLAALFRVFTAEGRYAYFSQDHVASVGLRGTPFERAPGSAHDALADAAISMALFHAYCAASRDPAHLLRMQEATLAAPRAPSFAVRHPLFEGCCQGNKRTCTCGAPFFS